MHVHEVTLYPLSRHRLNWAKFDFIIIDISVNSYRIFKRLLSNCLEFKALSICFCSYFETPISEWLSLLDTSESRCAVPIHNAVPQSCGGLVSLNGKIRQKCPIYKFWTVKSQYHLRYH